MPSIKFAETPYGFEWGGGKFQRGFSDEKKGWVCLIVDTPKTSLQVYVTKTGKVRVADKHFEWKPRKSK